MHTHATLIPQRIAAGFTLVELLVAMVIGLLVIGGVMQIAISSRAAYQESQRFATLQDNVRFATDFMARDIRGAEGISFDSSTGQLSVTRNRTLRWCGVEPGTDTVIYRITGGALRCQGQEIIRGLGAAPNNWVTLNDPDDPISVTITLPLIVFDTTVEELQFIVALRNPILQRYNE